MRNLSDVVYTRFLPEGTNVQVPPYVLHRDPRYFSNPDKFWPDRWILSASSTSSSSDAKNQEGSSSSTEEGDSASVTSSDAEDSSNAPGTPIVHEKCAFIPFSTGPANCAGKPLALMELRYVIALLTRKFELDFQEGFDVEGWESTLTDRLTMFRGPLLVNLRKRKVAS
jgi:cytochrome P450